MDVLKIGREQVACDATGTVSHGGDRVHGTSPNLQDSFVEIDKKQTWRDMYDYLRVMARERF